MKITPLTLSLHSQMWDISSCRSSEGDLLQTAVCFVLRANVTHSGHFVAVT